MVSRNLRRLLKGCRHWNKESSLIPLARGGTLVENAEVFLQATNSLTRFDCPKTGNETAGAQRLAAVAQQIVIPLISSKILRNADEIVDTVL